MIRSGVPTNQGGNISDSDSDWDTTVDFPSPRQSASNTALDSGGEDVPPTPRTRSTVKAKDDDIPLDETGAPPVYDDKAPASARREKTAVSTSNIQLSAQSTGRGDYRNPSPVPPFTSGFRDALHNSSDVETSQADPPPGRDRRGNLYHPTPHQTVTPKSSGGLGSWDDSDAEQRTLRELHTTLRKEKNREIENEAARLQTSAQDADATPMTGRSTSMLEKWMQGREDKRRQKNMPDSARSAGFGHQRKAGVSCPPIEWSAREDNNENAVPFGGAAPYRSMIVKDPEGRRYLYYFCETSTTFYEVEDVDTDAVMPKIAEKVEMYVRRGWQELFGALRIVTSIVILLAVEAVSYVISHVVNPLFVGVVTAFGNRLLKPLLAGIFNVIFQPVVVFLWNVFSGVRHFLQPVIDTLGALMSRLAILVQAFRLVEVNLGENYLRRREKVLAVRGGARQDIEVV